MPALPSSGSSARLTAPYGGGRGQGTFPCARSQGRCAPYAWLHFGSSRWNGISIMRWSWPRSCSLRSMTACISRWRSPAERKSFPPIGGSSAPSGADPSWPARSCSSARPHTDPGGWTAPGRREYLLANGITGPGRGRGEMSKDIGHWIDGRRVVGSSGRHGDVFNPAVGEKSGRVAFASAAEVDAAVQAAKAAFPKWATTTPLRRARVMFALKALIEEHIDELAELVTS